MRSQTPAITCRGVQCCVAGTTDSASSGSRSRSSSRVTVQLRGAMAPSRLLVFLLVVLRAWDVGAAPWRRRGLGRRQMRASTRPWQCGQHPLHLRVLAMGARERAWGSSSSLGWSQPCLGPWLCYSLAGSWLSAPWTSILGRDLLRRADVQRSRGGWVGSAICLGAQCTEVRHGSSSFLFVHRRGWRQRVSSFPAGFQG